MLESYGIDRLFAGVDVTLHEDGQEIQSIIELNHKSMPKHNRSYKSKNGTPIEVIFSKEKCKIKFYFRSWRYKVESFYLKA